MNPNCWQAFLLEDTFNSDHSQKALAVALSAPFSKDPFGRSILVWSCARCLMLCRDVAAAMQCVLLRVQ